MGNFALAHAELAVVDSVRQTVYSFNRGGKGHPSFFITQRASAEWHFDTGKVDKGLALLNPLLQHYRHLQSGVETHHQMTHYEPPAQKSGLSSRVGGVVGVAGVGVAVNAEGYMIGDEEELHSDVEMEIEDHEYDYDQDRNGASEHKGQGLDSGLASGPGLGYTLMLESKTSSVEHAEALLLHAEVGSKQITNPHLSRPTHTCPY